MILNFFLLTFSLLFNMALHASFNTELCKNLNFKSKELKNDCKRIDDLKSISSALDKSFRIHLNYTQPEKMHMDNSISLKGNWCSDSDLKVLIKEGFLNSLPLDPINNKEYFYFYEVLNDLKQPFYQLCASKLETINKPYCVSPKRYRFYSDHLFVTSKIIINRKLLTIVTGNILYGGGSPNAPEIDSALSDQVNLIKKIHPDIVLLQEVEISTARVLTRDTSILKLYKNSIDYFMKKLTLNYYRYDTFKKLNLGTSGKLFLSKYPINNYKKINKDLSIIEVNINGITIVFANMHLKPIDKKNINRKQEIMLSINNLINLYPNNPIVLAGDFFMNNLNFKNYGFIDTYKCTKKHTIKYTNTVISKRRKRYDYIFIRNLKCVIDTNEILLPIVE